MFCVCTLLSITNDVAPARTRVSLSSPRRPPCLHEKRLRGEAVDGAVGVKAGRSHASRAKRKEVVQRSKEQHTTRDDMVLSWEARRGSSTALIGLGRGREALAEAVEAMEVADQVRVFCACHIPTSSVLVLMKTHWCPHLTYRRHRPSVKYSGLCFNLCFCARKPVSHHTSK